MDLSAGHVGKETDDTTTESIDQIAEGHMRGEKIGGPFYFKYTHQTIEYMHMNMTYMNKCQHH